MSENERFVRGNEWLTRAMSDPDTRERVETIEGEMEQVERTYRMNLAAIRHAADLTQTEVAERMGVKQGAVSAVERRDDLLLSTLANYLNATGATAPRIVITTSDGRDVEYPLTAPRPASTA